MKHLPASGSARARARFAISNQRASSDAYAVARDRRLDDDTLAWWQKLAERRAETARLWLGIKEKDYEQC